MVSAKQDHIETAKVGMVFRGSLDEFKDVLKEAGLVATEMAAKGHRRFQTHDRVTIDWWDSSKKGTVYVSGAPLPAQAVSEKLEAVFGPDVSSRLKLMDEVTHHIGFFGFTTNCLDETRLELSAGWLPMAVIMEDHGDESFSLDAEYGTERGLAPEILEGINGTCRICRARVIDDSQLVITARWSGPYSRKAFGEFLVQWCTELVTVIDAVRGG